MTSEYDRGSARTGASGARRAPGRRALRAAAGAAAALLLGAAGVACGEDGAGGGAPGDGAGPGPQSELHGAVLPEPRPKGDFTLTATDGEAFDFREETDGDVTLLFFGYTHCPNACPVQMATLGAAYEKLSWELKDRIQVVFVTTDPARDTLPRLRSWLDDFSESFVGLRGSRDEVDRIMESYGLPPAQIDSTDPGPGGSDDGYTVGHAAHVLVFTPDDRLRLTYPTGTRQKAWVEDLRTLAGEGTAAAEPEDGGEGGGDPGAATGGA